MKKIDVKLYRLENFIYGKVLEIPEEIRGRGILICEDGFDIRSMGYPSLCGNTLFLRGTLKDQDNDWISCQYENDNEADLALRHFLKLIEISNRKHDFTIKALDNLERKYLRDFLTPFKNDVLFLVKQKKESKEFIRIVFFDDVIIDLPRFDNGKMYKNMELNIKYTAYDLGLFND